MVVAALLVPAAATAEVAPDPEFGADGSVEVPLEAPAQDRRVRVESVANGVSLVVEFAPFDESIRVHRLEADGRADTAYAGDGTLTLPSAPRGVAAPLNDAETAREVRTGSDGDVFQLFARPILLDGNRTRLRLAVGHVLPDGEVDAAYGTSSGFARWTTATSSAHHTFRAWALDEQGRVLVFAERGYRTVLVYRLTAAGVLDASFGGDGLVVLNRRDAYGLRFGGVAGGRPHLVLDASSRTPEGRVVPAWRVVRLTDTGRLDPSFSSDGELLLSNRKLGGHVLDAELDGAGRVLLDVGRGDPSAGSWRALDLERITLAGRRDGAFADRTTAVTRGTAKYLLDAGVDVLGGRPVLLWARGDRLATLTDSVTGFEDDGARWLDLGPDGTAQALPAALADDAARLYTARPARTEAVTVTRLLVEVSP